MFFSYRELGIGFYLGFGKYGWWVVVFIFRVVFLNKVFVISCYVGRVRGELIDLGV